MHVSASNIPFILKMTFSGPHMPGAGGGGGGGGGRFNDRNSRINGPQHIVRDRLEREHYGRLLFCIFQITFIFR